MHKAGMIKRASATVVMAAAIYGAVAYFLLPSLWRDHERGRVDGPMLTTTTQGIPGDPINIGLVGDRNEILHAFSAAGWRPADPITFDSSIEIGISVVFDRPDPEAPVSTLLYDGKPQNLAFEKLVGESADRRNHVRLWLKDVDGPGGRPFWLGSASFDRGSGISHDTGAITHHIGPDIDAERDLLIADLEKAGALEETYRIPGIGPTKDGRNGGGDPYFTDGEAIVGVLKP